MKNSTLAKIALVGAVLASSLSAASAATRQHVRTNAAASALHYGYGMGPLSNPNDQQFVDNEQARRDLEGQGG